MAVRALDTNLLVRFVLGQQGPQDNATQYATAVRELQKGDVFIPDSVVLETVWVLSRVYKLQLADYVAELRAIGGMQEVTLENPQRIAHALAWHAAGMDFGDALHLAAAQDGECATLSTFDADFVKKAKGKTPVKVLVPSPHAPR